MGLGKTLQSIVFLHTILTHPLISQTIKRVLIVCPKNVILNWENEFRKWLIENDNTISQLSVYELDSARNHKERVKCLEKWYSSKRPSVAIIGYEMFRNLTQDYTVANKKTGKVAANQPSKKKLIEMQSEFRRYLQDPGPDLIICDEGHKLKNLDSELSKTIVKIRTKRRICLTGTPLQNNLGEYYTMINFVKPSLLGPVSEFRNRFENPIKKGQLADSDAYDVRLMRRRCHVLYTKLKGIVDRRDFNVLKDSLLPKLEYVITLRMTQRQIDLYKLFLETECNSTDNRKNLLANFYTFSRIIAHPYQIIARHEEQKNSGEMDDFIVEGTDSSDSTNEESL